LEGPLAPADSIAGTGCRVAHRTEERMTRTPVHPPREVLATKTHYGRPALRTVALKTVSPKEEAVREPQREK
jgi:hypothetical protein